MGEGQWEVDVRDGIERVGVGVGAEWGWSWGWGGMGLGIWWGLVELGS